MNLAQQLWLLKRSACNWQAHHRAEILRSRMRQNYLDLKPRGAGNRALRRLEEMDEAWLLVIEAEAA